MFMQTSYSQVGMYLTKMFVVLWLKTQPKKCMSMCVLTFSKLFCIMENQFLYLHTDLMSKQLSKTIKVSPSPKGDLKIYVRYTIRKTGQKNGQFYTIIGFFGLSLLHLKPLWSKMQRFCLLLPFFCIFHKIHTLSFSRFDKIFLQFL